MRHHHDVLLFIIYMSSNGSEPKEDVILHECFFRLTRFLILFLDNNMRTKSTLTVLFYILIDWSRSYLPVLIKIGRRFDPPSIDLNKS